jgi:hypothetical protein
MSLKEDFASVSPTARAIGVGLVGAAIAVAGRLAGGGIAVTVVGCGLIALALALLSVAQVVQFLEASRSQRFGSGLQRDVSDKFRQGWQRLAKAGKDKDPYFLPWYIMVGEPGAGKTQAIKHSQIKFVPGFNDPAAGEGGTLAMDWWFADKAILLDTAGALLMDTARTEEFQEFLHRVRQHRPKLPLNGLILAIPANALQTDTVAEIQAKATIIAQQLDLVHRELGVRFPVYVIISKADLISGFREFFDNIRDPTMPTQMLGWSNPAGLDGAFDPAQVETHLDSVAAALRRRRLGLLLDPAGDEQAVSRVDKMDALYAFPGQLQQVGMRLRTYLDHVFMPSEWSQAPLFLRGIYFTSSMREGPPLDLDLAQAFNISPRDLPAEVRVWEREKSCFLRDLFVEKIFREKGLVTASTQVDKRVRRRRNMVLAIGLTAIVAVIGFTLFGYFQLQQSVGGEYDFWTAVTRYSPDHPEAADVDWAGESPDTPLDSLGIRYSDATTLADVYGANLKLAQQEIRTPLIFYFARGFGGDLNTEHLAAHRLLFQRGLSRAAWAWLMEQRPWGAQMAWPWDAQLAASQRQGNPGQWTLADQSGERVLAQLILMDLAGAPHESSDTLSPEESQRVKDLLHAAGWPEDTGSVRTFRDAWLWFAEHAPSVEGQINPNADKWAGECVERMIGYYKDAFSPGMEARSALIADVQDFDRKEQAFLQSAGGASDAAAIQQAWSSPALSDLLDAGNKLAGALKNLAELPGQGGGPQPFGQLYDGGGATAGINAMGDLVAAIGSNSSVNDLVQELQTASDSLRSSLADESAKPREQLAQLTSWKDGDLNDWSNWPFMRRLEGYRAVAGAWAVAKSENLSNDLATAAALLKSTGFGDADRNGAQAVYLRGLEIAARHSAAAAWDAALSADEKELTSALAFSGKPLALPPIPYATIEHPPASGFAVATASKLIARMQERHKLWAAAPIVPLDKDALAARLDKNQALLQQYLSAYAAAWEGALSLKVFVPKDFNTGDIDVAPTSLNQFGEAVRAALAILPPDAKVTAVLNSIVAGESAQSDLAGRGNRLLGFWTLVKLNPQGYHDNHDWIRDLHLFDSEPPSYVTDYWKGLSRSVGISFDLLDRNPSIQVSVAGPQDSNAPPDAAADLEQVKSTTPLITYGIASPIAIDSNSGQGIKLDDGLDVRLLDSNNPPEPKDSAGGADQMEVVTLLLDPANPSVPSAADPSVWYVRLQTQLHRTLWLKLKFGPDAPDLLNWTAPPLTQGAN